MTMGIEIRGLDEAKKQLEDMIYGLTEGLNGQTPIEACGIKVEGENKWITLIQNASKLQN